MKSHSVIIKYYSALFFVVIAQYLFGQSSSIDNLLNLLRKEKNDSIKLEINTKICDSCNIIDNLKYGQQGLDLIRNIRSKKNKNLSDDFLLKKEANYINIIRVYYQDKNNQDQIYELDKKLVTLYSALKDTNNVEETYISMADYLKNNNKINDAFDLIQQRLNYYEKTNYFKYIAKYQGALASLYDKINYNSKMLEYRRKCLETTIKLNDVKAIAFEYAKLAQALRYNKMYKEALTSSLKSLEYFEKENDDRKIFRSIHEIAETYNGLNQPQKALEFTNRGMEIAQKYGDSSLVDWMNWVRFESFCKLKEFGKAESCCINLFNSAVRNNFEFNILNVSLMLSRIHLETKSPQNVFKYLNYADPLILKYKDIYAMRNSYDIKFNLYKQLGDYKKALENRLKFEELSDSITKSENHNGFEKRELLAEFEKNEAKKEEEQRLKDIKISEEKRIQSFIIIFVSIGFILVLITLVFVFRNFKIKKKSNIELAEKNNQISYQKHLVEEKQKEIVDSISYAKRLQDAILPPIDFVNKYLQKNFIYYQPKDIVAGDFYWAEKVDDLFFMAAADSTGHGVPGAMVSVVCSNALNRSIKEFKLTETGKILDKARELVIETFEKSMNDVKDGMDISLLCIDSKNKLIYWSGANNPLWYIKDSELKEIKADKQPIGKTELPKPFTTHQIDYIENTTFYLFTDGLADQFGGPNGKKFKYKQFSELLIKNNHLSEKEQADLINKTFTNWKGELEQVDDVCVIGIKI